MANKILSIKNMVCPRCISSVKTIMEESGMRVKAISLGEVEVLTENEIDFEIIDSKLKAQGFELIQDKEAQLIVQIKAHILEYLENIESVHVKLSEYLASKTDLNYTYLSKVFSKNEQDTIEKYFILLKIEKAKELISYNELSLGEIAFQLGYSSPQALSGQFKSVLGMTVSEYKDSSNKQRGSLDNLT